MVRRELGLARRLRRQTPPYGEGQPGRPEVATYHYRVVQNHHLRNAARLQRTLRIGISLAPHYRVTERVDFRDVGAHELMGKAMTPVVVGGLGLLGHMARLQDAVLGCVKCPQLPDVGEPLYHCERDAA